MIQMKTLLVGINAKYIHTNLAIRYLYTYTKDDFQVDFVEFTIKDDVDQMVETILQKQPKLLGLSCYIWNIEMIKEIIVKIKSQNPSILILLGGPEVSYDIDYYFNALPIDFIISGEGEYTFKILLQHLFDHLDLTPIPQLHFKLNNKIISNNKEYNIDFIKLPSPYRLERDLNDLDKRIQYIESSRGCPYRCSYCLASLEKNVRQFNSEKVKEEIRYLMQHGAKVFKFLDRTFNMRKEYALDIFKFIIKEHQVNCVFQFEITGELLDEDIINYLNHHAPKGLIRFEIGVQSTNDYTNELILRRQNFKKLAYNIQLIQQGDKIDLHLDLIAGLPKEDYQSFKKTFNDVFLLYPHELQLGFLKMLRGTKIRKEAHLYHYHYHEEAPYEIIENDCISNEELMNIHLAEEMLEKYYNSHRFDTTIQYILQACYPKNPYDFFEGFGIYWNQHYSQIRYQLHDLCTRLLEYIQINHQDQFKRIESLLIFDYLKVQKTKPKKWYKSNITKEKRHELYQNIMTNNLVNTNLDQLYRYGIIEELMMNPLNYQEEITYLLKLFSPENQNYYLLSI